MINFVRARNDIQYYCKKVRVQGRILANRKLNHWSQILKKDCRDFACFINLLLKLRYILCAVTNGFYIQYIMASLGVVETFVQLCATVKFN